MNYTLNSVNIDQIRRIILKIRLINLPIWSILIEFDEIYLECEVLWLEFD